MTSSELDRVALAIGRVIAREQVYEEVRANRMPIKDAPKAVEDMAKHMMRELQPHAKAALEAMKEAAE